MTRLQANLQIHFCVLVWGFTAILGKLISLNALNLVLWRMSLTAVCLALFAYLAVPRVREWLIARDTKKAATAHDLGLMVATGVLIALHWVAFYASVKLANASIAVVCMAVGPIFNALLAPVLGEGAFSWRNFLLSCSVLPGMVMVVGGVQVQFYQGIIAGVIAALLVALFSLYNKKLVDRFQVLPLSFVQIGAGAVLLLPCTLISDGALAWPAYRDWWWLLIFVVLCTALPFALASKSLRVMSSFSAQFAVNLEPVYGVIFAAWLLNETQQLTQAFYWGAALIVCAVFAQMLLSMRDSKTVAA